LIEKAGSLGIRIINSCPVQQIYSDEKGIRLETAAGNFFSRKLLFCTNAFIGQHFPELDVVPGRGQVLITKPIKNLKLKGTFHYDKGFYYFRNVGERVLLGGARNLDFEGEKTTEFGESPEIQAALHHLLQEVILPDQSFEIEQKWSGIMAFGSAVDPIIRQLQPNIFCAVRGHGMGIAIGSETGEELAEMLQKEI